MFFFNLICYAISGLLCFICVDKIRKGQASVSLNEAGEKGDRWYCLALVGVFLLALFLRLYQFGEIPYGVWNDGAMAAVDAKALAEYGTDRYGMEYPVHLTAWGYGQMSPLLSYLMVPFIKLLGMSAAVIRMPSLIVSILGLACLYLLMRDVFNKHLALVVLGFAAINPWHVMQSRIALDCNLYPHFFLFGIYLLHKGITQKKRFVYLSMVLFGLSMYCYGVSVYTMPVFLVAACLYLLITNNIKVCDAAICVLIYLGISWPFYAVMAVNFFGLESFEFLWFTIPYFPDSVRSNDILFFSDHFFPDLGANIIGFLFIIVQVYTDNILSMVPHFGTMYIFSVPFMFFGVYTIVKNVKDNVGSMLCLLFCLTGVFVGLTTSSDEMWRFNLIYYPLIFLTGIGLYECFIIIKGSHWVAIPVYLLAGVLFFNSYLTLNQNTTGIPFYPGFCEALTESKDMDVDRYYITNRMLSKDFETYSFDRSEVLTMFYHDVDSQEYYGIGAYEDEKPGKDQYVYGAFESSVVPIEGEKAVYILHSTEVGLFDETYFKLISYGDYYLALVR